MSAVRRFTEDALPDAGAFGFRLRWVVDKAWVDVEVYEIFCRQEDGRLSLKSSADECAPTDDIDAAEQYLRATIKWDGCSHFTFGDRNGDGYLHLCGPTAYRAHADLVCHLYRRAFELMGREPEDGYP